MGDQRCCCKLCFITRGEGTREVEERCANEEGDEDSWLRCEHGDPLFLTNALWASNFWDDMWLTFERGEDLLACGCKPMGGARGPVASDTFRQLSLEENPDTQPEAFRCKRFRRWRHSRSSSATRSRNATMSRCKDSGAGVSVGPCVTPDVASDVALGGHGMSIVVPSVNDL